MEHLIEELHEVKTIIAKQSEEIERLKKRIFVLEHPEEPEVTVTVHETVDLKRLSKNKFQLTRFEAGMVAFSVIGHPIATLTITLDEKMPPQYLYFGLAPRPDVSIAQNECFLLNTAGKARIPGFGWEDLQEGFREQVISGRKFCFQTGRQCFLTVDDGRRINTFSKDELESWYCVIGLFGEGTVFVDVSL